MGTTCQSQSSGREALCGDTATMGCVIDEDGYNGITLVNLEPTAQNENELSDLLQFREPEDHYRSLLVIDHLDPQLREREPEETNILDLPIFDATDLVDATIVVELQKTEPAQKIGFCSYPCKGSHSIEAIHPGSLLDRWNQENPGSEVQRGDHIVEVNGVRYDEAKMMKEWTSQNMICMRIVAATVIEFGIQKKPNDMLGIRTRVCGKVHQIIGIAAGGLVDHLSRIQTLNKKKLRIGDYIVEVNGMRGDAKLLRQEWLSSNKVDLVVMSPRPLWNVPRNATNVAGNTPEAEELVEIPPLLQAQDG